ncbi:MAG: peptidoglycan DD-metalloendopeptidase family protein [Gammaproteobacteria bacterium]|nr:peptidoglycan DD-metalloendopeptidase family protein [Gammaproteobacteria bacterium]
MNGCPLQRLLLVAAIFLLAACSSAVRWEESAKRSPASTTAPDAGSRPGFHTVRAGETLYSISFRYGLSVQALAAWNSLGDGTLIHVGQRLRLSPPGSSVGSSSPVPSPRSPMPAAEAPPRWLWPVPGPVVARYGESPLTASGVQLGGRAGDPVRAAAGGQVVYAGSGLVGYGELLIIKHSPNWLSAYGYNQALLVREGDRVATGQPIARMGEGPTAGTRTRRSLLHFEIRRNGVPVDPLTQLPPAR